MAPAGAASSPQASFGSGRGTRRASPTHVSRGFEDAAADVVAIATQLADQGEDAAKRVTLERIQRQILRDLRDPVLDVETVAPWACP